MLRVVFNLGPTHWGEQYNTCFGKHQSPIDINSLQVRRMNFSPLLLNGFDLLPNQTTITNNGHTGIHYTIIHISIQFHITCK